jgi:hypothetical protein
MTQGEPDDRDEAKRFAVLESQLRSLPAPQVPDQLLGALLADIPARPAAAAHRMRASLSWLAGAAAAAAVLIALTLGRDSRNGQLESSASVSVEYVLHPFTPKQETDPC